MEFELTESVRVAFSKDKRGKGVLSDDLGDGEISLLSLWQAVYS